MKIVAIIPARGGSKGITKKNLRFLGGTPLIYYSIQTALKSNYINDVIVTSENEEILTYAGNFNVICHKRPAELSEDSTPLDPVITETVLWYEKHFSDVDVVITLQPTSPTLKTTTLDKAIEYFLNSDLDCVLSVSDDTGLTWRIQNGVPEPEYVRRVNRQYLEKRYLETGAFVINRREILQNGSRISGKIGVFEVTKEESIDIDDEIDWLCAESIINRKSFIFVVLANTEIGTGHLKRALTISDRLIGHQRKFILLQPSNWAKNMLSETNYIYEVANSFSEILKLISNSSEEIVINDVLDTSAEYVREIKQLGKFVVNFEDLGEGSDECHLAFNDLYERSNCPENHKYGERYYILDRNFLLVPPNEFHPRVKDILITFGGVDKNNLSLKVAKAIKEFGTELWDLSYKFILGTGYPYQEELEEYLSNAKFKYEIKRDVRNMALEMKGVDLAITSNGRTIYELAYMRIPTISISQNDRETMHLFSRYSKGVKYLGISCTISEEKIAEEVKKLVFDIEKRKAMYDELEKTDLKHGFENVIEEIEKYYRRWKNAGNNNR